MLVGRLFRFKDIILLDDLVDMCKLGDEVVRILLVLCNGYNIWDFFFFNFLCLFFYYCVVNDVVVNMLLLCRLFVDDSLF